MQNYKVVGSSGKFSQLESFEAIDDADANFEARHRASLFAQAVGDSNYQYSVWCGTDDDNMRPVKP
jgi:hypothetical protein